MPQSILFNKTNKVMKKNINNIEIQAFLKEWRINTKDELEIFDGEKNIKIKQEHLMNLFTSLLEGFKNNSTNNIIYGVDVMKNFKINIANEKVLHKIAQDVWDNPDEYYPGDVMDYNSYYDFLKFIWVKIGNTGYRLTDIVNTETVNEK